MRIRACKWAPGGACTLCDPQKSPEVSLLTPPICLPPGSAGSAQILGTEVGRTQLPAQPGSCVGWHPSALPSEFKLIQNHCDSSGVGLLLQIPQVRDPVQCEGAEVITRHARGALCVPFVPTLIYFES